jgi:hypothetical protein
MLNVDGRCECPDDSIDHEKHDCQNTAEHKVERVNREGSYRTIWVCGECKLTSDRVIPKKTGEARFKRTFGGLRTGYIPGHVLDRSRY